MQSFHSIPFITIDSEMNSTLYMYVSECTGLTFYFLISIRRSTYFEVLQNLTGGGRIIDAVCRKGVGVGVVSTEHKGILSFGQMELERDFQKG